ncbi:UDP-3-O-(3-hydroxymyristoyl)glucosamine N-acyltransferase [candidate division KSB1 bacterium]
MKTALNELAALIDGTVIGDGTTEIERVAKLDEADAGSISFLANPKYLKYLENTQASAVIVSRDISESVTNLIQVDNPYSAFNKVLVHFFPFPEISEHFIHPTAQIAHDAKVVEPVHIAAFAVIEPGSTIGEKTSVGAHTYIGKDAKIGSNTFLHPRVTVLDECCIGNFCIIHSGVVIGSDGFGFVPEKDTYEKIPQIGNVVVGDHVEIGANTVIDRASMGSTVIADGCKFDNLIHIAHNVTIGENTAIAAQAGIAGSSKLGRHVSLSGQTGVIGHLEVGDNSALTAKSVAMSSVPPNSIYFGIPAREHRSAKRIQACLTRLPDLFQRVRHIESKDDK